MHSCRLCVECNQIRLSSWLIGVGGEKFSNIQVIEQRLFEFIRIFETQKLDSSPKKVKKISRKKNEENLNWILDSVSLASELIYSAPHRASSKRSKSKTGTLSGTLTIIAKQGLFYYTRAAPMLRLLLFFSYLMPAWHRLNSPLPLHHHFAVARRFRASLDRNFTFCCQCLGQA